MKKKAALKRRVYTDPPMGKLNPLAEKEMATIATDDASDMPEKKAKKDEVSSSAAREGGTLFDPSPSDCALHAR